MVRGGGGSGGYICVARQRTFLVISSIFWRGGGGCQSSETNVVKYHSTHQTAQTQNLDDEDSFDMLYKMIAEQPFLTQYERPIYHMKEKINTVSTDTNFRFFDFERLRIESRVPFSFLCLLTLGLFTKERIPFRKPFRNVIQTLSWYESVIYPLRTQSSFISGFWNALLKHEKKGALDRDPRRKPDSEGMWTQSSFGMWFVRVHFGNARWSHA